MENFYAILEVSVSATQDQVSTAYRKLALKCHPDKPGGSNETFVRLRRAYEVLTDPRSRCSYDQAWRDTYPEQEQPQAEPENPQNEENVRQEDEDIHVHVDEPNTPEFEEELDWWYSDILTGIDNLLITFDHIRHDMSWAAHAVDCRNYMRPGNTLVTDIIAANARMRRDARFLRLQRHIIYLQVSPLGRFGPADPSILDFSRLDKVEARVNVYYGLTSQIVECAEAVVNDINGPKWAGRMKWADKMAEFEVLVASWPC